MRLLFVLLSVFVAAIAQAQVGEPLKSIPIQDAGRIKPFDTFARESMRLVHGRTEYKGKPAAEVVFTWLLIPDVWMTTPFIEITHAGVREALKLTDKKQKLFSPQDLFSNERLPLIFQELQTLRSRQEKLNPYYQDVQRLENQLGLFQAIRTGQAFRFVPDPASDKWKSVAELDGEVQQAFMAMTKGFADSISAGPEGEAKPTPEFKMAVQEFIKTARAQAPERYADMKRISWEEHLNQFHPFKWAWLAYLLGVMFLVTNVLTGFRWASWASWIFLILGFGLHTYGMGVRSYLAGRPPVSNMYETVVWVPWGSVLFGVILYWWQKTKLLLGAAATVAVFCLILTDLAPTVLDSSIHPLEPVLRSTFWLSTHVTIITISYAAFFLAFAMGDLLLFFYLKDETKYAKEIASGTQSIYRAMQIGVVLLAAGTILGGVWADYSWGRFWGWDPKETWALIALLGYLALLHGRLVGWVKNFELAAGSVVLFALVIMAWYGVNFVLGAGLHSYGFGAGGVEYVAGFVVIHLLYVAYVSTVRYGRQKSLSK